ncbi:MAG: single-stranded-DNA-specific exonuclease RecJ, partial [Clostridiales bacterium]|nr:single-stranded-DNA-specific exonuclease RecJ [Clostridiales bacterium]
MFDSNWIYKIEDSKDINIISELLKLRGIEDIDSFINPSIDKLHSPFLLNDMDKAVKRIVTAIENKEKIYIYGDYDADGLTSAAILVRFFKSLKIETRYYIPDRFDDGYGLNVESLQSLISKGAQLIVTTDCGVNSVKEVDYLKKHGIDIIITDHHKSTGILPEAEAVICCTRLDNKYPYINLSGAGIAYKLTEAISHFLKIINKDKNLLVLATLGTVADIVKLDGENRILVSNGLKLIQEGVNIGIEAILNVASVKREDVDTYTLGFVVGPRINAAGRMGKANRALELLICDDLVKAEKIANDLTILNNKRKSIQDKIFEKILGQLVQNPEISSMPVIVAGGEGYNKGVIGIVASKISEIYKKPTIIYS